MDDDHGTGTGTGDSGASGAGRPDDRRSGDLADLVVARARTLDRSGVWIGLRVLLGLVAVGYLVTAVPELLLSDDPHHAHLAHHLAIFEAAYGVALLFVAARPARARALVPFTLVLAGGMAVMAVVDVSRGKAGILGETTHLLELAGLLLVWLLAIRWSWPGRSGTGRRVDPSGGPAAAAPPRLVAVPAPEGAGRGEPDDGPGQAGRGVRRAG